MSSRPRRTTIPKGFRFLPSGEELLCDYLEKKNQGSTDSQITGVIPEIDVCKHEPGAIPALVFKMAVFVAVFVDYYSYTQWHFFSPRDYKYSNGTRSNRTTQQGFWKITGKDRAIKARGSNVEIGRKRTLTFYLHGDGERKANKTDWVIHEYYLTAKGEQVGDFVLCCLKNKSDKFDHDKDAPFFDGGEPGMITEEEELLAYKELGDAVQIPNGNEDALINGLQTNCVEGQLDTCNHSADSDMIYELLDDPENLDSLFLQHSPPPQPHQLPQSHPPQNYHPMASTLQSPIYEQLENVSHSTSVSNDESRKRNYPFGDNDPSLTKKKKNNISTDDDDELGRNTASTSENQAADWIPEGYSQPGEDLGLVWWDQPQAALSINGGPRDSFQNNNYIELDDLPSSFEGIGSFLAKFSDTIIDSGVSGDRNTELAHGSDAQNINIIQYPIMASNMGGAPKKNPTAEQHHRPRSVKLQRQYIAVYLPQKKLKPSTGSRQQFKAGSNLKGSFIFPGCISFRSVKHLSDTSHSSSLAGSYGQCNCSTVANLEAALHSSCALLHGCWSLKDLLIIIRQQYSVLLLVNEVLGSIL